ncbi:hypothetical protein Ddye_028290 [Dipteronia dyeriana]|uniref:F-box domain-containing protein n=1 Tax=Dipteronia dyeriana TaxID=168575 RepID=A0AAD9TRL1_9ROSI|nr:hypothetical protein Ddye_028290 [Dipteronia dyeriana]
MVKLPEDMIIEILLILPVKSLIRFRCVCKSWNVEVQSCSFISKHLKNDHNIRLVILHTKVEKDFFDFPCDSYTWFPDKTLGELSLQNFLPQIPIRGFFHGPFDGILCIIADDISLYNIGTKELRTLPKILHSNEDCVGFGLDPVSNSYKLVLMDTPYLKTVEGSERRVSPIVVYTLNSDSWRNIEDSNISDIYNLDSRGISGTCLNGVCYWLSTYRYTKEKVIFPFHLGDEMSREIIKLPMENKYGLFLGIYNESLSLLHMDSDVTKCVDMWVMNQGCWTKQLTVGPFIELDVLCPLGFWRRGSFFVSARNPDTKAGYYMRENLILYDPSSTHNTKYSCVFTGYMLEELFIYKESLVNLKGNDH